MTLRILSSVFTLLISVPCFAHLELGEYRGVTANGDVCSFKVLNVSYAYDRAHPLNERISIEAAGTTFVLSHLPQLNTETSTVGFDRDHLSGAQGTAFGGLAAVLGMSHVEGHHGPTTFTVIHHNYKDANDTGNVTCDKLVHQE